MTRPITCQLDPVLDLVLERVVDVPRSRCTGATLSAMVIGLVRYRSSPPRVASMASEA